MKHSLIFFIAALLFILNAHSQNVGIGTTSPNAPFNVAVNKTVLFGDDTTTSSGTNKLMWLPSKGAFRAGKLSFLDSIGLYSAGIGYQTEANNNYSIALGNQTMATGNSSTALGFATESSGFGSTAMGYFTSANGDGSTAMGGLTHASNSYSTAMGLQTTASGARSTAMGTNASTNNHSQSFCIGGGTNTNNIFPMVANNADNQMMMYFDDYIFYTGTSGQGVELPKNGNSWTTICDKNKKENFELLNGEGILKRISKINFTSWNYKGLDPKKYRHYGIMAQDFYEAFGKDKYGIIGTDTTVNPIDMIGIDMAAIKALEKRTEKIELLENKNKKIESENAVLLEKLEEMAGEIKQLKQMVDAEAYGTRTKNAVIVKN
jgi:hypothetical protein